MLIYLQTTLMFRLVHHQLRTSLLLVILATAFNSVLACSFCEMAPALTDSIPKPAFSKTVNVVPLPPPPTNCAEPFRIVEQMPRFPGCEHFTNEHERKICGDKSLLEYLFANIQLTPIQIQSCVVGTVVIQFTIEVDGSVTDAKVMRDVGTGYGYAALKAVESMNENGIRWIPGRDKGQAVRVQYNVPVRIHLE